MTILFYTIDVLSKIYGLAATMFNIVIMMCAIIALVLQQWNNFGIAVAILVFSYIIIGLWDVVVAVFAGVTEFFMEILLA